MEEELGTGRAIVLQDIWSRSIRSRLAFSNFGFRCVSALKILTAAGGIAGSLAWFGSFPLDVIKSILQGNVFIEGKKSSWQIAQERWTELGFRGFYTGVGPSVIRAFFVAGCRFSIFEFAFKWFTKLGESLSDNTEMPL